MQINKDWLEGKVKISGKEYPVAVIKGARYIDGKTPEEFLKTLSPREQAAFFVIGMTALKDEAKKEKPIVDKYQNMVNQMTEGR